jgi:hypothetical protein
MKATKILMQIFIFITSMPFCILYAQNIETNTPLDSKTQTASYDSAAKLFPAPGSKRFYLHQPSDYKIVQGRPDLKFQIKNATNKEYVTGYGFVILKGKTAESFNFKRSRQQFADDALPMLKQTITQNGFEFEQDAFTTVVQGRSLLMVRLKITPQAKTESNSISLAWLMTRQPHRQFHSHPNEDYIEFEPSAQAWENGLVLDFQDGVLYNGTTISAFIRHSDNVAISTNGPISAALTLDISFTDTKKGVIDLFIPYEGVQLPRDEKDDGLLWRSEKAFLRGQKQLLAAVSFEKEYAKQMNNWQRCLQRATQISVPEPIVNQIYRTHTLGNLQFLGSEPGVNYLRPGQGGFNNFSVVYGWESSHYLTVMDKQGFHDETRRVLDYFLTTQQGEHGPQGDISTAEGSFRPHIHWMCETGAILRIFAEHAICSGDNAGLRQDSPALLKAALWIQNERARTKQFDSSGNKVLHYGLMPPGRATDWPDFGYFIFTDAFTWQGLDRLARAYEEANLPEADWLRQEANDYHTCILDAIYGSIKPHPLDPSLQWISDEIYEDPAHVMATTIYTGPMSILNSGVLAADDTLFSVMEQSLRKSGCMDDNFAFKMRTMEDKTLKSRQEESAGGPVDLYYVTNCERGWQRNWLLRGERLKALNYFYMTLAYATSRDVHVSHERFCPQLPWMLPWQPNASGNGRILEMILNSLVLEQDDSMCLLYGAPDAWFDAGKELGMTKLHTSWGEFSFQLTPEKEAESYQFTYKIDGNVPGRFLLAVPSPDEKKGRKIIEIPSQKQKTATCFIKNGHIITQ